MEIPEIFRRRNKMSDEKKSFGELLNESPLAAGENTISLVGALARSHHPGKFVLALAGNQSVTLDIDAVKEYTVLSGMIGQLIVQVEIDRDRVPGSLAQPQASQAAIPGFKNPLHEVSTTFVTDHTYTSPWLDQTGFYGDILGHKDPITDFPGTYPALSPGDPWQLAGGHAGLAAPFALATPHQAPPSALAAMGGGPFGGAVPLFRTVGWFDNRVLPWHTGGFPHPD
jgi:hypothetical protein